MTTTKLKKLNVVKLQRIIVDDNNVLDLTRVPNAVKTSAAAVENIHLNGVVSINNVIR